MITCQSCQAQLLHHLYGLLEEAENQALVNHLAACPACRAALETAKGQQQILAAAAKTTFPSVRFSPVTRPGGAEPASRLPPPRPGRHWGRWAIAACLLLAVGGMGYAGLTAFVYSRHVNTAQAELAAANAQQQAAVVAHTKQQNAIQTDIARIEEQLRLTETQYRDARLSIQREFDTKAVHFTVTHPKTLQAGAPNQLTIEAKPNAKAPPSPKVELVALVVDDKTKAEVVRLALRAGDNNVILPADLPLKPGAQLSLKVLAKEPGQDDKTLVEDSLPLVTSLYVTHLTTDRPMYRPGEVVYFRSLTLERFSLKPAAEDFALHFRLVKALGGQEQNVEVLGADDKPAQLIGAAKLKGQDGKVLLGPDGKELRGIGAGSFKLPDTLGGGEYTLIVSDSHDRFPAERRKLIVNKYQAPRLYKDVDFTRKSYSPGDTVTASCKVSLVEGGRVLSGQPVVASANVDGQPCEILTANVKTDASGQCVVQFKLPAKIERGEGVLSVIFTDGANQETTVEPIPIVLNKLKVDFYPEGGELVAGVTNRVYFQVRTMIDKPAELRGRIIDKDGKDVAALHTVNDAKEIGVNQGMGRFDFTPVDGQSYELKIDDPSGIEGRFVLPPVQQSGVALHLPNGVVTNKIDVVLHSAGRDRKLLVGAYCRGQMLDSQTVTVAQGKPAALTLKPAAGVGGVYRVTVFEIVGKDELKPVAERLLYRRSPDKLNLQVFTDKTGYSPGDRVTLSLKATDQHNQPAPAIVLVSVVDKSILKLRNDRTARSMPTHFLLTSEVRGPEDLEYADVLLREQSKDGFGLDVAKAEVALDLLLGTQGWRRFIEQKSPAERAKIVPAFQDDTKRLLVVNGQDAGQQLKETVMHAGNAQVAKALVAKHVELQRELGAREAAQEKGQTALANEQQRLAVALAEKHEAVNEAETRREEFMARLPRLVALGVAIALTVLSVILITTGCFRANNGRPGGVGLLTAGVMCFLLLIGGTLAWVGNVGRIRSESMATDRVVAGRAAVEREGLVIDELDAKPRDERRAVPPMAPQMQQFKANDLKEADFKKADAKAAAPERAKLEQRGAANKDNDLAPGKGQAGKGNADLDRLKALGYVGAGKNKKANLAAPAKAPPVAEFGPAGGKAMAKAGAAPAPPANFAAEMQDRAQARPGEQQGGGRAKARDWFPGDDDDKGMAFDLNADRLDATPELRRAGKFADATKQRLQLMTPHDTTTIGLGTGTMAEYLAEAFALREYAHQHKTNPNLIRSDFAETIYWHPALIIPGDKPLDVRFDLSDAVTQFEVKVWGNTQGGQLGAVTKDVSARLPFSLDAKLPIEISSTDKIAIPIALANDSEKNRHVQLKVEADNLKLTDAAQADQLLPLAAHGRVRKVVQLQPSVVQGIAKVRLLGQSEPFGSDSIERSFQIVPEGFPIAAKHSDMLEKVAEHVVKLPAKREQWVPGTLKLQALVMPSTLADLQKGLEAMLREPGGCFEQTSSSNYPNIMILDYLKESNQVQPAIEKRAVALLNSGYGQLVAFECIDPQTAVKKQGYEWFGQTAPPHEALTAYGLLQFLDMAKYHPVDKDMLERTTKYLLQQRDGKGGFKRNQRALDQFGQAPVHITDAYIVWALTEANVKEDISKELETAFANANKSEDPYMLALVSLSLVNRGQSDKAVTLLTKLKAAQKPDGSLMAKETSITHSGGTQLAVETTSLAILAWLRANQPVQFGDNVRKSADWIGKQRGGQGGYGSTQSTVLALKALIAFTRENKKTAEAGELKLTVNGHQVAVKAFAAGTTDPIVVELNDEQLLQPGDNKIRVEITGKNEFPYTLTWSYMAVTPANKDVCPVRLETRMEAARATEGQTLRVTTVLENTSGKEQGMAVAIIGLPGGCALPADLQELRKLVREGKIDAFEIRGRELVLYWRGLAKDAKHEVNIHVICQVPGQYRGPASRAYLYYNTDERWWVDPLAVDIAAKD